MQLRVGHSYLRADLHASFGGSPRAGICPTASGPVLIFSDPPSGTKFGYDQHDEVVGAVYRYTGEGRAGDQQFIRGNKAVMSGRDLLLFSRIDQKSWRFVGKVGLDSTPYEMALAPDQQGFERQVIVFRFIEHDADFGLLGRN